MDQTLNLFARRHVPAWVRYRIQEIRGRDLFAGYPNDHRCIFIHIPKTAGTSIARALFNQPRGHIPYFKYQNVNSRKFNQFFKFSFVRNPWDRLVSAYYFLKQDEVFEEHRIFVEAELSIYPNFDKFVIDWVNERNIWKNDMFKPQAYYICDDNNIAMDFVGRVENINEDFNIICSRLKINRELIHDNKSKRGDYREIYTERTKNIVERVYEQDINMFGYEFD